MASWMRQKQNPVQPSKPPFSPEAIRHLPSGRQRRYQRLLVLWSLKQAGRDLTVSEIRDWTRLDDRTIRSELDSLVSTRVVERIHHKNFSTFKLLGRPTSAFAKHMVQLRHNVYTIEHVTTDDGRELLILQERESRPDGSSEPIGGLAISKEDLPELLRNIRLRAEENLDLTIKEE